MNTHRIETIARCLTASLSAVVLAYLVVFSIAQPSPQLIGATIFEVLLFMGLLGYRRWNSNRPESKEVAHVLVSIENGNKIVASIKRFCTYLSIFAAGAVLIFATVDLTALVAANTAQYQISRPLYVLTAPPTWSGLQPAFSLEVLAGACVESQSFEKAESLEFENLSVRKTLVGENHELIASSFCDLGDLYRHWNRLQTSETYYRKAIELAARINYYRGYGKPMTSLACILRDQRRYGEAQLSFEKALFIRRKLFGSKSEKYSETLLEYARLLKAAGKDSEAERAQSCGEAVRTELAVKNKKETMTPLMVSCVALALFTQKDRVILLIAKCMK